MSTVAQPALAPVSFLRGGLTMGSMVYLEGTWGYIPETMAEWDEETQLKKLGDVFYAKGVRPNFPPAAESYVAPTFREQSAPVAGNAPPSLQVIPPGQPDPQPERVDVPSTPVETSEFAALDDLPIEELRAHLAELPDSELAAFAAWERSRPAPREELLAELV